jgi:TetR/AcrR family transcriptional repressor of nem operon
MLDNVPRKSVDTRERLLELAESAVLAKGFAATSIDELIAAAGISKSGFFYHFKDKGELAKGLLVRYLDRIGSCSNTFSGAATISTKTRCTASWSG